MSFELAHKSDMLYKSELGGKIYDVAWYVQGGQPLGEKTATSEEAPTSKTNFKQMDRNALGTCQDYVGIFLV